MTSSLDHAIEKLGALTMAHKRLQSAVRAFLRNPNADTIEAMREAAEVEVRIIEVVSVGN